ncbi:hypothetical protein BDW22DRAFT_1371441 [Trametopsis cervina]|nr:hypothetical protein BDW22DRAFT_1371441 [Trametopsis cervina]
MASVLVPLLYVFIVFGGLWVFSTLYKRHIANQEIEPYFGQHRERDIYVSLLQRTDPPAPDSLLKAALVRRAVTDVYRIMRIREDKPALQNLLQKGSIGDELWNSLLAAERELEAEILETAAEANTFVDGWGSLIFQTATELLANEKMRKVIEGMESIRAEKEQRYGLKTVRPAVSVAAPALGPLSKPVLASLPSTPVKSAAQASAPPTPSSVAASLPGTPSTATSILSPAGPSTESVASSDGEGPRTPSKSAKKNKKRK